MVDRHVITKQPSVKSTIKKIEAQLAFETDTRGKKQLQKALDYWKGREQK